MKKVVVIFSNKVKGLLDRYLFQDGNVYIFEDGNNFKFNN